MEQKVRGQNQIKTEYSFCEPLHNLRNPEAVVCLLKSTQLSDTETSGLYL